MQNECAFAYVCAFMSSFACPCVCVFACRHVRVCELQSRAIVADSLEVAAIANHFSRGVWRRRDAVMTGLTEKLCPTSQLAGPV